MYRPICRRLRLSRFHRVDFKEAVRKGSAGVMGIAGRATGAKDGHTGIVRLAAGAGAVHAELLGLAEVAFSLGERSVENHAAWRGGGSQDWLAPQRTLK